MHDSMADDIDALSLAGEGYLAGSQKVQAFGNCRPMVERLGDLDLWLAVSNLKVDQCLRSPDFLYCTFSQKTILVSGNQLQISLNQLELDGGTATVQYKRFHQINSRNGIQKQGQAPHLTISQEMQTALTMMGYRYLLLPRSLF